MGAWTTIDLAVAARVWRVTLSRPDKRNVLSRTMLDEVSTVLDRAVAERAVMLVLDGGAGDFCAGMDFHELVGPGAPDDSRPLHEAFAGILRRLADSPLLTVARLDGAALGGGVGLAAACDWVIATQRASFALPEALWRLVPALAGLYLSRRIGRQRGCAMALITEPVTAATAAAWGLVDELVADAKAAEAALRRLSLRMSRIEPEAAQAVKSVFGGLPTVDSLDEKRAVDAITALADQPGPRSKLKAYLETGRVPWDQGTLSPKT